jgi:Zn-dependent metalloprotease
MVIKTPPFKHLAPLLGLALAGLPAIPQAAQSATKPALQELRQSLEAASGDAVEISQSPVTGLATFVSATPGKPIPTFAAPTASPEERGRQFLINYGKVFGISAPDQVRVQRVQAKDEVGMDHVRFTQVRNGVPVRGGEIILHLRGGDATSASAKTLPDLDAVDTRPVLGAAQALAAAQALLVKQLKVSDAKLSKPQLEIFNRGLFDGKSSSPSRLAWFIEATKIDVRELIWVDAQRGAVLLHFSQITDAKSRSIYNTNNSNVLPGTLVRSEGGPATADNDVNKAYDFSGDTYDYYLTQHGRDSYDGAGAKLISTTHYCPSSSSCPYKNAFWNGVQMVYGEGFSAADDVDAHELTHAVTERSASLAYFMESGALNESFSDIFGETVDLTNTGGTDTTAVRWLMGEDIPGIGAIRNMMNPNQFGDPGKVSDSQFICNNPGYDNGGVHINSGVPNHAYALMVDGGTYNGQTVTGIGLAKAGKIQYRVLTKYLPSTADFQADYTALQQACTDLVGTAGITATDCAQVKKALDAVEMNSNTCSPPDTPALCPTGQAASNLFFDNLEAINSGKWSNTVAAGINHWNGCYGTPDIYCPLYPTSGDYMFWGYDYDSVGDSNVAMTADVAIPSTGTPRLQFNHAFGFDSYGTTYYDGGVVEYSTNSGSTWTDAGSLISAGAKYGGVIDSNWNNPLKGKNAFVGSSLGYTASQLNLASLAGKSARFRFRVGTDISVGDVGWFIDDVRIYNCASSAAPDFVVTAATLTPASPSPNGTFNAVLTVKNQGNAAGTAGTLQVWGNQSATQVCGAVGNKSASIGSLAAGASTQVTLTGIPAGASGVKTLRAFIDSQCVTTESNETNNQFTQNYTVAGPDFAVTALAVSPTAPTIKGTFTATVTIKNQGTAAGNGGYVDVWVNQPAAQTCPADGNAFAAVGTLAAGASTTITLKNLPAGLAGAKTLRAFVDSSCQTAETNEGNNQATLAYTVSGGPDFIVTAITPYPSSPKAKTAFSATVTVKNQGTVAGNGGFVDVWANQSASQTCPTDGDNFAAVGTLAAGASKNVVVYGLPAGKAGAKTLRAYVDSYCQTAESNEANNQITKAYTVVP